MTIARACRSSGTWAILSARASVGCSQAPVVKVRPSIVNCPDVGWRRPASTSSNSLCPLPDTPATPTISPARNCKSMPSSRSTPSESFRQMLLACSFTGPTVFTVSAALPVATLRPTIASANWSVEVLAIATRATTRPPRITVTSSHRRMTSLSLWVIKIMVVPCARSKVNTPNSCSVSCGVRTAVGSSSIKIRAPRYSAFKISSRCWSPTGSSLTGTSSATFKPVVVISACIRSRTTRFARPSSACGSAPSMTFSIAVKVSTSMKC